MTPVGGTSANFRVLFCDGADGFGEVGADLLRVDVEGSHELQVGHVVVAELHVHQAGHPALRGGIAVVLDALHERGRTVADSDDGDPDRVLGPGGRRRGAGG